MRKLSSFLIGCFLVSSSILCLEAVGVPVEPAPAWYTYPRIKRVPWGKNMERIMYQQPGLFQPAMDMTKRDVSPSVESTPDPGIGTVAETVGSKDHQPPCNCARCAGRLQKRFVKVPANKPRFLFGGAYPYGDYYEDYYDDYYDGYPYGGYNGGYFGGGGFGGGQWGYPYAGMGYGGHW